MKKIGLISLILFSLVLFHGTSGAEEARKHVDAAEKYSISYPGNFTLDLKRKDLKAYIASPEGIASVGIMIQNGNINPGDYIAAVEQKLGQKNLVNPAKRLIPEAQAKAVGADAAAIGAFTIQTSSGPVLQGWSVMVKNGKIYIVLQTLSESGKKLYGKNISDIARSFRILN